MKKKSLVLFSFPMIFSILLFLLFVGSKNLLAQEISIDEVKTFMQSFNWKDAFTRRLAINTISIVPEGHREVAIAKLKTALQKNAANTSGNMVSSEVFLTSVREIVPSKILPYVLKILSKVK